MIVDTIKIPCRHGETIKIRPISDVHCGNVWADMKLFKKHVQGIDDMTYILGVGDWFDLIIPSDLKRYRKSGDATSSDDAINCVVEEMADIIEPKINQILGLGIGNHEDSIIKHCSFNPIRALCDKFNIRQLGYSFLLRIILYDAVHNGHGRSIYIFGHHGWGGGGRTEGADLTKFWRHAKGFEADIYLYGHVHKKQDDHRMRLAMNGKEVITKPKYLIICGTYQKTLSNTTDTTHAESKGFEPTALGCYEIELTVTNKWLDVDVHAVK